jgi:DNA-binding response OmpR family regulator
LGFFEALPVPMATSERRAMQVAQRSRILIVDDDPAVRELLHLYLDREHFEVASAVDGREAMRLFHEWHPDLILLDLALPVMHGLEVCRAIRRTSHVPIIVVSALAEEFDRVGALELGADDYVTKPFSAPEVVARVKAVLRGCALAAGEGEVITLPGLRIHLSQHRVEVEGKEVYLTGSEFRLLWCLASQSGHVLGLPELARCALRSSGGNTLSNTALHLRHLRRKLRGPSRLVSISALRGLGYKLDANGAPGCSHGACSGGDCCQGPP